MIDQANDAIAIDCRRNGLPEPHILKPALLFCDLRVPFGREVVQVEEEKVVLEPRSQVIQVIATHGLLFLEDGKVFSAEPAENVRVAGLKSNHLRVLTRDEQEHKFIEVRKTVSCAILLPIIGVF